MGATKEQKEEAKGFVDLIKKAKGSQKVYFAVGKGASGPVVHIDKKKPNACVSSVKAKKASTIIASGQIKFDDDLALCCLKQPSEGEVRKSFFQFFKESEASIPGVSESKIRVLSPKEWDSAAEDEDAPAGAQPPAPAQPAAQAPDRPASAAPPSQAATQPSGTWATASGPAAAAATPARAPLGQQRMPPLPSVPPAQTAAQQLAAVADAYKTLVPQMQAKVAADPSTKEGLTRVAGVFQAAHKAGDVDRARAALDELTRLSQGVQAPPRPAAPSPDAPPPPQSIGPMVVLWRGDFGQLAGEQVPWLKMSAVVQLAINNDIIDLLDKEDRAGATKMFMIDDAQQLCEKYAEQFVDKLMNLDMGGARRNVTMQEIEKATRDAFDQLRPRLEQELQQIPQRRWQKFQSAKTKWRDYKIKAATNVVVGSLQIAMGALSIAAAVPTMGGTLPLAIIATARGVYKTATEVVEILKDAEHHQKELLVNMTNLVKAYQQSKARVIGQEITATLLKGLLGSDALFIESLPKCEKTYTAWEANVALLRIRNVKFGNKATDLLDKIDKMEAVVDQSKPKNAAKALAKIESLRGLVTQLLDKSADLGERVGKAEKAGETIEPAMAELRSSVPDYLKIFDKIFPMAVSIGLAAGAGGLEIAHAEETIEIAKAAVELAGEVLDSAKEALEG